jgi:SAM-dependent MidA family methyltransferase
MADDPPPLEREIRRIIAAAGPMPVADYMRLCLTEPRHGYYMHGDPFGADGDFITAPEISQMFGELIGVWMAAVWQILGKPENIRLIELGPGRGTMMVDALRAAAVMKGFRDAMVLHLVEISPALREIQQQRLQSLDVPAMWHAALDEVPPGPAIIIANEFLDALPVHQAVKQGGAWHERVVDIGADGRLCFAVAREPLPHFDTGLPRAVRHAAEGAIFEWRSDRCALELGRRVRSGGVALILDYGHVRCGTGDTLQAVAGHAYTDPLQAPGRADLTAHVDFEALAQSAESIGGRIHGPVLQRDLLLRLGIGKRAMALTANASRDQALQIQLALARLTESGAKGMGELFKALAIADPKLSSLPGFEMPT